jgi:hypothetical protein
VVLWWPALSDDNEAPKREMTWKLSKLAASQLFDQTIDEPVVIELLDPVEVP